MNRSVFKIGITILLTCAFLSSKAQNSLDIQWGFHAPVNSKLDHAFSNSRAFRIGLQHPVSHSSFSAGISFSHQYYQSKRDFFKAGYASQFSIHHYLLTARYDFLHRNDFKIYTAIDAGLNKTKNRETRYDQVVEQRNKGFTTGIALGSEVKMSSHLMLGANIQGQYCYVNKIPFDDKITVNHFTSLAGNIGLRLLLGKKIVLTTK